MNIKNIKTKTLLTLNYVVYGDYFSFLAQCFAFLEVNWLLWLIVHLLNFLCSY